MTEVNLASIDLNLLVVVDAVLETRSATRAAERLNLTQSAVSNTLRRARDLFGDPLVVRTARGFAITAYGEALAPRLRGALDQVRRALGGPTRFDPATSTRRFTVATIDATAIVLVPRITALLSKRMPHATLGVVTLDRLLGNRGLEDSGIDLLIGMPPAAPPGCSSELLYEDPLVAVVREDHPRVGARLSLSVYADLPHAELALFGEAQDHVDRALAARGARRHVDVVVPYIAALPFLVAGTDRVTTLAVSMANAFAKPLGLRALTPPVEIEPVVVRHYWHRRLAHDPAHALLREIVRNAARGMGRRQG